MRFALIIVLSFGAIAAAEFGEDPWVEEEELEEPYNEEEYKHERSRRAAVEDEEVAGCDEPERVRRSAEAARARRPRQVHQYEVHELGEESALPAVPYEEMLAASAEHYHRVYSGAKTARHLDADVSRSSNTLGVRVPSYPTQIGSANLLSHLQPPQGVGNPVPTNFASAAVQGPVSVSAANGIAPVLVPAPPPLLHQLGDQLHAGNKHHHAYAHGGGQANQGQRYDNFGTDSNKGIKSDHYIGNGRKGFKKDENHRKEYEEAAGKKTKHHDNAGHKGDHEEEAFGSRGSHFQAKKGHKKGHKSKGYHNKYHKDEFQKEHKFYDDFHKSGEHHRYGKFNAKHASNESGKKKAHHVNAGHDFMERGKKGYSNKGHVDADHQGYKGKSGQEEHNENHSQYGKKGGKEGGSQWGHAKN